MKNRAELINKFIEARVKGESFDEIVKNIGVSKPTLIKWSRFYQNEINHAKTFLAEATAKEIVERNINFIKALADYIDRNAKGNKKYTEDNHRIIKRISKRIYGMFRKELHSIKFKMTRTGEIHYFILEFEKKSDRADLMVGDNLKL